MTVAKALWATVSAACVIWSVGRAGWTWGWAPALIAFAVLVAPIQNSFQHLQITTLLLALVVAAALDLQAGRERRAAVWIGGATAVKAFPALLLAYLAHQRRWRALAIGAGVAIILTVGAMLRYGVIGATAAVRDWILLNGQAAGVGGLHMQKLARLGYDMGGSLPVIIAAELIIVGAVAYALRRRAQPEDALADIGMVTLLAVLLSPIASYYYFGLLFPAWVAALRGPILADRRLWRAGLVPPAVRSQSGEGYLVAPLHRAGPRTLRAGGALEPRRREGVLGRAERLLPRLGASARAALDHGLAPHRPGSRGGGKAPPEQLRAPERHAHSPGAHRRDRRGAGAPA